MSTKRVTVELIKDEPVSYDDFWRTVDRNLNGDDVYQRYLERFQSWRWNAKGGNGEIMARGESYFNRGDAIEAIETLFGGHTGVWLRYGDVETQLRAAT